jgi:hypothetical protein
MDLERSAGNESLITVDEFHDLGRRNVIPSKCSLNSDIKII